MCETKCPPRTHLRKSAKPSWFGMREEPVCNSQNHGAYIKPIMTNRPHQVTCKLCIATIMVAPHKLERDITIFRALYLGQSVKRISLMFGVTPPMVRTWIQQRVWVLASVNYDVYDIFLKDKQPRTWGSRLPTQDSWLALIKANDVKKHKEALKPLFDTLANDVFTGGRKLT